MANIPVLNLAQRIPALGDTTTFVTKITGLINDLVAWSISANQAGTDIENNVQLVTTKTNEAAQSAGQAQAIAVGNLNWLVKSTAHTFANGDSIAFNGSTNTVFSLPATIATGQQWVVKNIGTANVTIAATASITMTDDSGVLAVNGDNVIIQPQGTLRFLVIDANNVRVF